MKWLQWLIKHIRDTNARIFPPHEWEYRTNPETLADERLCACGQCEEFMFGSGMGGDDWKVLAVGDMSMHKAAGLTKVDQAPSAPATIAGCIPEPIEKQPSMSTLP